MSPTLYEKAKKIIVFNSAIILMLLVVGILFIGFMLLLPALLPFMVAVLISFMIEPLVNVIQRLIKVSRSVAVTISMMLILVILGSILFLAVLQLISELVSLSTLLPDFMQQIREYSDKALPQAIHIYGTLPDEAVTYLQDTIKNLGNIANDFIQNTVAVLIKFISVLPGTFVTFIVSLLAIFFITKDKKSIVIYWKKIIPTPYAEGSLHVLREIMGGFWSYLKAQSILVTITILISIIGFKIIGVKYALTFGLSVGIFDLIPVLGPATLFLPMIVWFFLQGSNYLAVELVVLYGIIFTVRQLFESRVVASSLGMHPLAALMAMYFGLKFIGVLGLVLGPILLLGLIAAIKAINLLNKVK